MGKQVTVAEQDERDRENQRYWAQVRAEQRAAEQRAAAARATEAVQRAGGQR